MSDPERILFQQEALVRFPRDVTDQGPPFASKPVLEQREAFVNGAMFAAHLIKKQRVHADRDEKSRDQFATAAMAALISGGMKSPPPGMTMFEVIALASYEQADAMLKAKKDTIR